ncbi:MAG: hypothetical protein ACXVP0_05100 [Bacteroidia bacterium]
MKKTIVLLISLAVLGLKAQAQDHVYPEKYGRTLNLGLGMGYYATANHPLPMLNLNYEFDVFRNFTLAPFAGFESYSGYYSWGNYGEPYHNYSYRQTVIPLGLKATYYFDEWLRAGSRWDFYIGTSLGFAYTSMTWESSYHGNVSSVSNVVNPFYAAMHVGAEYHMTKRTGIFLDLSNVGSTFGFGFHF